MAKMKYATVHGVANPVSRLFFGCATPKMLAGENVDPLLEAAYNSGITAFDTARNYGSSEVSLGHWLQTSGRRGNIVLLSKCAHHDIDTGRKRVTPQDIREDLAVSLSNLQTDFIDIYLLHRDDPGVPVGPIVEVLNELHTNGSIGVFGGSNWSHQRIAEANEYAYKHNLLPFSVSSPNFGLAEQVKDPWGGGCVTISGRENADAREWYRQNQMPVIAYSSLGRGLFSGLVKSGEAQQATRFMDAPAMEGYASPDNFERLRRAEELAAQKGCTVAQIALAWIFHQTLNVFAVFSTTNPARIEQNILALDVPLTQQEALYLNLQA
ncbi:MAG: aldo/keto reductase [Oscillospiraceae bacterium]